MYTDNSLGKLRLYLYIVGQSCDVGFSLKVVQLPLPFLVWFIAYCPQLEAGKNWELALLTFLSGCRHNLFVHLLMFLGLSSRLCREFSAQRNRHTHGHMTCHLHRITCSQSHDNSHEVGHMTCHLHRITCSQSHNNSHEVGHTITWFGYKLAEWFGSSEGTFWNSLKVMPR